jgi:predicted translin family RNA/ssDNA-binding protein
MATLSKQHFVRLRKEYATYEDARRELIKFSGDALSLSKQAIFALHRGDRTKAEELLAAARAVQTALAKKFAKIPGLVWEGSYRALLEEFAEASLYLDYVRGRTIGAVAAEGMDADAYLGGLMDFTGELVRRAVAAATAGDVKEVERCLETARAIAAELIVMNIVGPLRPKYDQTKTNLRKLEEITYDIALRRH